MLFLIWLLPSRHIIWFYQYSSSYRSSSYSDTLNTLVCSSRGFTVLCQAQKYEHAGVDEVDFVIWKTLVFTSCHKENQGSFSCTMTPLPLTLLQPVREEKGSVVHLRHCLNVMVSSLEKVKNLLPVGKIWFTVNIRRLVWGWSEGIQCQCFFHTWNCRWNSSIPKL